MTFTQAITSGFRRYLDFKTRSSRSEYWWWTLFSMLSSAVATICDETLFGTDSNPLYTINALVLFIPGIAVAVRRLHDTNRSGWWFLLAFTVIGILLLIYWYIQPGTRGINRYGHEPLKSTLDQYSERPADQYTEGTAFLDQHQFEQARAYFDKALLLKPNEPEALFLRAIALEGLEDPNLHGQALADCDIAIKARPRNHQYRWIRSRLLLALGRYEESLSDADKAIRLRPGDFDPHSVQQFYLFAATASIVMVEDLRKEALEFLKRAIYCDPETYRNLARQEDDFYLLSVDPKYGNQFRELVGTRLRNNQETETSVRTESCVNCGAKLSIDDNFCPSCGIKI